MTSPDFSALTKSESRAYVIAHPHDRTAFYRFVDRCTAAAAPETFDLPNSTARIAAVENLIRQKLAQLKAS